MNDEAPPDFTRGWRGLTWTDPDLDDDARACIEEAIASRNYFCGSETLADWLREREMGRATNGYGKEAGGVPDEAADRGGVEGAASARVVEVGGRAKGRGRRKHAAGPSLF
ncbi:hypothetical protein [Paludisphaera soli]|uniref:hypothetical protein n=1 Tax=Paludisphaera soli TaxID=2712865 RepID=UPI0013ED36DB|nr:hypothetical protein [Paludisphaera soli]